MIKEKLFALQYMYMTADPSKEYDKIYQEIILNPKWYVLYVQVQIIHSFIYLFHGFYSTSKGEEQQNNETKKKD